MKIKLKIKGGFGGEKYRNFVLFIIDIIKGDIEIIESEDNWISDDYSLGAHKFLQESLELIRQYAKNHNIDIGEEDGTSKNNGISKNA